jgi:2,3-diketo-5-methylthio-1-phosphopentane phosphatase
MKPNPLLEVYFDFDNTITGFDVLDDIILRFSVDDRWKLAEAAWESGEIGSRECLERQFTGVRISEEALGDYIGAVRIDPAFAQIVELLAGVGIRPVILSDSFKSVISAILKNNGVSGIEVFANEMHLEGSVPVLEFPYFGSICSTAGNCKTSHLLRRGRPAGTRKVYVGDGRSDICPAQFCEILFAKGSLYQHYSAIRGNCFHFEELGTVHAHLKTLIP